MFCMCGGSKVVDEPPPVVQEPAVQQPINQPDGITADATCKAASQTVGKLSPEDLLVTEDSWNTSQTPASPSDGENGTGSSQQWTNMAADQFFMPVNEQQQFTFQQPMDCGWEPCSAGSLAGRHPSDYNTNPLLGNTRYKKLRDLGAGTYGFVLLAHDTMHGDLCAIKFLEVCASG